MAVCTHDWESCLAPPDGAFPWYRCKTCKVFGFRRTRSNRIRAYKCQINGCEELAVDRLHGRGPRLCYLWRCSEHLKK
jgi:hypothetical protein